MLNTFIPSTNPATLLVPAGSRPALIVNADQADTLWIGSTNDIIAGNTDAVPISPNGFLSVDGSEDIYAVGDPASIDNGVFVYVIPGGMSFFQLFNQLVIQGSNAGLFIYSPFPGTGTLIGSWAAQSGTDIYGNLYPAGINVFSGALQGIALSNSQIINSLIQQCTLANPIINQPAISGGTMQETNILFDPTGGRLLIYSQTTTTQVFNTPGDFTFTGPANVTSAKVELWGAAAGAGGGNASVGGETGGGGEYAAEPNYPITTGVVYNGVIGAGGLGGITGQSGQDGQDTTFDGQNIIANGGTAGLNLKAGKGGTGSTATIHNNGGNGADAGTSTGGSSGGNSGTPTAAGNNGIRATTGAGAAAPVAQANGGQGGAGGGNAADGTSGGAPGGAGGACGAGSATNTITKTYNATSSRSYYGADGSQPNGTRVSNGTMFQGGETASGGSFNGTQKSACLFNSGQIQSDFAGATMKSGTFKIVNQHSWYNNGLSVQVKEWPSALGTSLPGSWNGTGAPLISTPFLSEGATLRLSLSAAIANSFKTGADRGIAIGPGPGSFNLNYYGYFNGTPNSSGGPQLTLTGTVGAGSNNAGNGNNGQCIITYALTQTLIVSLAGTAGTDAFGNAYPAGLGIAQPSGQYVKVSGASTDLSTRTVTAIGNNQMTVLWAIPANDAKAGTIYRMTTWGTGTQAATTSVQLNTNLFLNGAAGTNLDNTNMSLTIIPAGTNFHWHYVVEVIVATTGVGGTCVVAGKFTMSQAVATTPTNSATASMSDTGKAFNTTISNTIGLFAGWASTTGAPTITCAGSLFERLGP